MLALVASLAALQSPLAKLVTFDEPAMPLARLLPALSRASGVEVLASGTVAKDVALVRAQGKSLGEILRRLAQEDGADVEATKTGFRVVRTPTSERKERAASLERRAASLAAGLASMRKSLSLPADSASYRSLLPSLASVSRSSMGWVRSGVVTPRSRLSATRAAMRGLLLVPVGVLADLREGDRVVYSNRPTRLQTRLPALEGVLQSFEREQNAWSGVAQGQTVETSRDADDPFRHVAPLDGPPSRAVLIVSRSNSADAALARIVILDGAGDEVGSSSYGLQSSEDARALSALVGPSEAAVPTSAETEAFIKGVPRLDGTGPATASAAATALLSEPERRDPLSFGATDLLRDLAGEGSIVAVLPDRAWLVGLIGKDGLTRRDRSFLASTVDVRTEGGWTLAHPLDPGAARTDRVDRAVLGRFVRTIVASRRVPIDAYADYAYNGSDAPSDVVGVIVAMMLEGGTFNPDVDWRALRLYGSLSPSDRKTMLAGSQKDWSSLSLRQRSLAALIASKRLDSFSGEIPGGRVRSTSLLMEPTEVFADGYDALTLKLSSRTDEPLFCDSTTNPRARGWRRVLDAESAGHTAAQADGPGFDRFGLASRTTYDLRVSAKRGTASGATLEDVVPPKGPLQPIEALPGAVRVAFARGKASAARENPGG